MSTFTIAAPLTTREVTVMCRGITEVLRDTVDETIYERLQADGTSVWQTDHPYPGREVPYLIMSADQDQLRVLPRLPLGGWIGLVRYLMENLLLTEVKVGEEQPAPYLTDGGAE